MKFRSEDNGNCRVYYTDSRKRLRNKLYCWQNDGSWGHTYWRFYVCSKDGEPSYSISPPDAGRNFSRSRAARLSRKATAMKLYAVESESQDRLFFSDRQAAIGCAKAFVSALVFEITIKLNKQSICNLANGQYSQRQIWPPKTK
jgi:hypothetical protein